MRNYFALLLVLLVVIISTGTFASSIDSFSLGADSSSTTNKTAEQITLTISATDVNEMCFMYSSSVPSSCSGSFVTYSGTKVISDYDSGIWDSDRNNAIYAFVVGNDNNYYGPLGAWALNDSTAPALSSSYPADGNYYAATSFDMNFVFSDTYSSIESPAIKVDGVTKSVTWSEPTATISSVGGFGVGDHNITIDVNDSLDNMRSITIEFTVDLNVPTGGAVSFSGWTSSDKPTFSLSSSDNSGTGQIKMRFSCNNSSYTDWVNYAASYSDFNINSSSYGCSRSDWNKSIYVKFRDSAGNADSNTHRVTVLYDNVAPSEPTDLRASAGSEKVTLTWDTPEQDGNSGNSRIEIYKNGSYYGDTNWGTTTYDVNNLNNGSTYTFKVRTKDAAGNYSGFTDSVDSTPSASTATLSVKKGSSTVSYAKNGDVLTIKCDYSESVNDLAIMYQRLSPNGSQTTLASEDSGTSVSDTYTVSSASYDRVGFWCEADGASDSDTAYVTIDNTSPDANWVDSNNIFDGIKKVLVRASDNKSLDTVKLDFNGKQNVLGKDSNGNYFYDLNTIPYENGAYTLKAIAADKAGNTKTIERSINLQNIQSAKQKATKAISDANSRKRTADALIEEYEEKGLLLGNSLREKKVSGDNAFNAAVNSLDSNSAHAELLAKNAASIYDEFNSSAAITPGAKVDYNYDSNSLVGKLTSLGVDTVNATQVAAGITQSNAKRTITLITAGSQNQRQMQVSITFRNDTDSNTVKIVEIIPKDFVATANKIVSNTPFRIINNDPVIEFTVDVNRGSTALITYGIGEVSKEAAEAMIANDISLKFSAPPILLEADAQAEKVLGKAVTGDSGLILIIGIIILIVIIVAAVVLLRFRGGHGFGESKSVIQHLAPEKEAEKKKFEANK